MLQDLLEAIMYHVESSNIASVGYEDGTLTVEFKSGGIYEYYYVPEIVYEHFLEAPSKGRYFIYHVRNDYSYNKIN